MKESDFDQKSCYPCISLVDKIGAKNSTYFIFILTQSSKKQVCCVFDKENSTLPYNILNTLAKTKTFPAKTFFSYAGLCQKLCCLELSSFCLGQEKPVLSYEKNFFTNEEFFCFGLL